MKTKDGCNIAQVAADLTIIEKRLKAAKIIGYDSETEGLDAYEHNIVGHVLSFGPAPDDTWYVPVRHGGGGNIKPVAKFEKLLTEVGKDRYRLWFGHNFQFDLRFLLRHNIRFLGEVEDTQVNAAVINELASSFSLDATSRAMGAIEKKGEDLYVHLAQQFGGEANKTSMGNFWRLAGNDPIGCDYATGDGVSTWDLRTKQWDKIEAEELEYIAKLERRITRVVYRMQMRGIRVDQDELQRVSEFAAAKVKEAAKVFPPGFSARSNNDVRAWVEAQGFTNAPYTPKGAKFAATGDLEEANKHRSFAKEYLKTIPPGQFILDVREFTNLESTFINPLRDRHIQADGRVHCTYYQMATDDYGTITGRFSCSNPNLQQVPKRNKNLGLPFRKVFIPEAGSEWLTADLSQCEPRILAHYSNCKTLVEGYTANPPIDAHASVTIAAELEQMLGVPFKEAREYGKRLNQTLLTGGGQAKIISMLGVKGAQIYDAYFEANPEIKKLLKNAEKRIRLKGYVVSYLGRKARLSSPDKAYVAANRLFQCGNADIIKQSLADMDAFYEDETNDEVYLMNTVHDSVDVNVPEGMRDVALRGLRFMAQYGPNRRFHLRVPMACEYGFGASWGDATYLAEQVMMGEDQNDVSFFDPNPVKPAPVPKEATVDAA